MRKLIPVIVTLIVFFILVSCNRTSQDSEYIKKVALNQETIAVGIYKATGFEYPNIKYIAEALKIDGGIVYVTLTDADVLKTKLENIDVILFPGMLNGQKIEKFDDEIADIFKNFISKNGKGAIGICNGGGILTNSQDCQSLGLVNIELKENSLTNFNAGIIKFKLSEQGVKLFPELDGFDNLMIDFNQGPEIKILDTISDINVLGEIANAEASFPMFITSKHGKGKIIITNGNPESTPGMRWMIPRMVRWSINKEFISYDNNVFRPDLLVNEVNLNEDLKSKIEKLLTQLDEGKKDEIISAMDELQEIYPWIAAEKVRYLLIEKNDDIKLRAAKYLVDVEYTLAIDDLRKLIKNERSKKVKEQLIAFKRELESMIEQN